MAKVKAGVTSFNGGEVGPKTLARVDLQGYSRFSEIMEGIWPDPQGSMSKMPGTIYLEDVAGGHTPVLRPFQFSASDNLVIVFMDELLRLVSGDTYLTVTAPSTTIGTLSDESAIPPTGGGAPPVWTPDPGFDFDVTDTGIG